MLRSLVFVFLISIMTLSPQHTTDSRSSSKITPKRRKTAAKPVHKITAKPKTGPKCTCECCDFLGREGGGARRVWKKDLMCKECLAHCKVVLDSGECDEDERNALFDYREKHIARTKRRNYKPGPPYTCNGCDFLGREGGGAGRVWRKDLMCEECLAHCKVVLDSGECDEDERNALFDYREKHLARTKRRNCKPCPTYTCNGCNFLGREGGGAGRVWKKDLMCEECLAHCKVVLDSGECDEDERNALFDYREKHLAYTKRKNENERKLKRVRKPGPKCTCKCCEYLRGKGQGKCRVNDGNLMCQECQDHYIGVLKSGECDQDEFNMLVDYYNAHCDKKKHINDLRSNSPSEQERHHRIVAMIAAKEKGDREEMVKISLESPSVKRRYELIARLKAQNEPTGLLEEIDRLFVMYPQALAAFATDSWFIDAIWNLKVKGASANICHFVADLVHKMKIFLEEEGSVFDAPKYTSRLNFVYHGVSHSVPFGERIHHGDFARIEDVMKWAKQLDKFRKIIQAENGGEVTKRNKNKTPPTVTLEDLAILIVESIEHPELQKYLLDVVDGNIDDSPENIRHMQNALCFGTFYSNIGTSMAASWVDEYFKFGFGGSHYTARFNARAFWKIVRLAGPKKRLEWLCRFVLSWASFDGSINTRYFQVLVPLDKSKDSLWKTMLKIFKEIFGDVYVHDEDERESKVPGGKSFVCLTISGEEDRAKVAEVLLPYVDGCLTEDRHENLWTYLNLEM